MEEVWKDIPDYEGYYQASNLGRIKSLDRKVADRSGVRIAKGKVLKPEMTRCGYLQVGLHKNGKLKMFSIHQLVWMTFNGSITEGYDVNHVNEVKTDNRLENLNLLTHKQNMNWGTRIERTAQANINNPLRSKPVVAIDANGKIVFQFPSTKEAARNGFNSGNLVSCCLGKLKSHRGYRWQYI